MTLYYTYSIHINNPKSSLHNKWYYGKHETNNIDDGYMGSGKIIKNYIKKYGVIGLEKNILSYYNNRYELCNAEEKLIEEMRKQRGTECLNMHQGGSGGHWVEYISKEEYNRRCQLVKDGVHKRFSKEELSQRAKYAGLSKRNKNKEWKDKMSEIYSASRKNMRKEDKDILYNKVSQSLKTYYNTEEGKIEWEERLKKNKDSNVCKSKEWREQFYSYFNHTPEYFRKYNKQKESLNLFNKIKNISNNEEIKNEIDRFMESIG